MKLFLQLRLARVLCDLALDFYYYRKMEETVKKRKMAIVNAVREDVMEELSKEKLKQV